ncbi:MAG: hypothetical protein ABSG43_22410, partial [Solirubrobacteraceae bacterium]
LLDRATLPPTEPESWQQASNQTNNQQTNKQRGLHVWVFAGVFGRCRVARHGISAGWPRFGLVLGA